MPEMPTIDISVMIAQADNTFILDLINRERNYQPDFMRLINTNWFIDRTEDKTGVFAWDTSSPGFPINAKTQLGIYIGLSTFNHCVDAWNFLARGIGALIRGDIYSCIHMVYYSELRSVMSILASKGIGVFDKAHIQFDAKGNLWKADSSKRAIGTHRFVELALNEIEQSNSSIISDIFNNVQIDGINLHDIVNVSGFNLSSLLGGHAFTKFFALWSIDLSIMSDRELRNTSSYRPAFQRNPVPNDMINRISEIWTALEPLPGNPFVQLDKAIIWETVDNLANITGTSKNSLIKTLSTTFQSSELNKLLNSVPYGKWILDETKKYQTQPKMCFSDPFPMIARAIFLGRMSAGMARSFMGNFDVDFILPWCLNFAEMVGIIESQSNVSNLDDLFVDILDALTPFDQITNSNSALFEISRNLAGELSTLSQFERVPLWGLGT